MKTIILNPEETLRLDYEANWKSLISYENYLSIKDQQEVYERNQKGNERVHNR